MAQIAAYRRAPGHVNGSVTIIVPQVVPVRCGPGKHRAFQVPAMAGLAGIGIVLVEILMLQVPACAVDVVHPMGSIQGKWQAGMAGTALDDAAGMALQLDGRQVVIGGRQCIRPDRMG